MKLARPRELAAIGLAVAIVVAAVATVAVYAPDWRDRGDGTPPRALTARSAVEPGYTLFGDVVTLHAHVVVDRNALDSGSVAVDARFTPFRLLSQTRSVRAAGGADRIDFAFRVQCVSLDCLHEAGLIEESGAVQATPIRLRGASVTAERRDGTRTSVALAWPAIVVHSRLTPGERIEDTTRAGAFPTPAPSYTVSPDLVGWLGVALGLVFALAGAGLLANAVRGKAVPLRLRIPGHLTPLDRALALVRDAAERDAAAEERRALERLAAVLRRSGYTQLAGAAGRMAWSREQPAATTVEELVDEVARSVNGR